MTKAPEIAPLYEMTAGELFELGLRRWDEPNEHGQTLWLFPREWYGAIPDGTPIVDIFYNRETFKRGETDDDYRGGMLSFGILVPPKAPNPDLSA